MTVKELKEILEDVPDEFIVVLAADSEGNSFSDVISIDFHNSNYKDGVVGLTTLGRHERAAGYTEEDVKDGSECIVLWPGW